MAHILLVDDDRAICRTLNHHFQQNGHRVTLGHTAEESVTLADSPDIDVVVSDVRLPGRDGLWLLVEIKKNHPTLPVIMMTAFHDFETTVAAMQGGAVDYVAKPIDLDELNAAVERALSRESLEEGLVIGPPGGVTTQIVGQSNVMKQVFKSIGLVAQSRITVLILGESGTGKELVARAVHNASPDRHHPFIAVNCAALVETLLESEMFGHERGAFTGAVTAHKGKVEQVGEGTLFLDEIAELSPRMQSKLLRILEEREYTPVGSTQVKKSKARFITATNVDLRERVANGQFREDLYYRLNVINVAVPALRERVGDALVLADHFAARYAHQEGCARISFTPEAAALLQAHPWPGNVRELKNLIERLTILYPGETITPGVLPQELRGALPHPAAPQSEPEALPTVTIDDQMDHAERQLLLEALSRSSGHKGRAAETLGISRHALKRRLQRLGL